MPFITHIFFVFLLVVGAVTGLAAQWTPTESSLLGEEDNIALANRTIKLSGDGKTCIFQVDSQLPNGSLSSEVKVFALVDGAWQQKGISFIFSQFDSSLGHALAISDDGNTIAMSDPFGAVKLVLVMTWTGSAWEQKGRTWVPATPNEFIGCQLDLSADGNVLLIADCHNHAHPVRAYRFVDHDWALLQDGVFTNISPNTRQLSAALSGDGTTVVIGNANEGETKVYRLNGEEWAQIGAVINGDNPDDGLGHKVAISDDGNTLALGTFNRRVPDCRDGYVKTYQLVGNEWLEKGSGFVARAGSDCNSRNFAEGLGLSGDGNTLVMGLPGYDTDIANEGGIFITHFNGLDWGPTSVFTGDEPQDLLGSQLAISRDGGTIATSSFYGGGNRFGQIEFFTLPAPENDGACNAIEIPANGVTQTGFTTLGATASEREQELATPANDLRHTVWFTFQAPPSGAVTVTTCGDTNFDTELTVFSGSFCDRFDSFTNISYNDDAEERCAVRNQSYLTLNSLTPGEWYFVMVDGWEGARGDFEITVTPEFPACDNPALAYDGVDDYVDLGPGQGDFSIRDFTIELMVKTDQTVNSPDNSHVAIAGKRQGCNCATNFWYLTLEPDGKGRMALFSDGCAQTVTLNTSDVINDGNWHHLAVTRSGSIYTLYVDGVPQVAGDFPAFNLNNDATLQLGSSACTEAGFGGIFQGEMDELRLWGIARSTTEIQAYRLQELRGDEEGLTGYYNFNDGIPNGDNEGRIGSIDLTGSASVARLNNFDRSGDGSNWINGTTGVIQLDRDADGLYDACNEPDDLPTATQWVELPGVHLGQNYPNPAATETIVPLTVPARYGSARLVITSALGRTVQTWSVPPGTTGAFRLPTHDLAAGLYTYTLLIDNHLAGTRRMVIAR
ncbi:MAG: LamG-like jellyroll fold domain-containing protein [Bacteroidota bacterium]